MESEVLLALGFVFVALYTFINIFKYYTKYLVYSLFTLLLTTVYLPLCLLMPFDFRTSWLMGKTSLVFAKLFGISYQVEGLENVIMDSPCVIVVNHQSAVDAISIASFWVHLKGCCIIMKKSIFYFWPVGLTAWLAGTLFIDRGNSAKSREIISKTANYIRANNLKVVIFAEGTRNLGKCILPFKKGAFHMAIDSKSFIQPVVISRYYFLDHEKKIFGSGKVIVRILPPISTIGKTKSDLDDLINETHNAMTKAYAGVNKEINATNLNT